MEILNTIMAIEKQKTRRSKETYNRAKEVYIGDQFSDRTV